MSRELEIQRVIDLISENVVCPLCETRLRFGDVECPHCGADLDDHLHGWAKGLVDELRAL
jgi:predicted amidophosphoribosyltransferase